MEAVSFRSLIAKLRSLGPYVLIELLLPGGTLVALALWFANSAKRARLADSQVAAQPTAAT